MFYTKKNSKINIWNSCNLKLTSKAKMFTSSDEDPSSDELLSALASLRTVVVCFFTAAVS